MIVGRPTLFRLVRRLAPVGRFDCTLSNGFFTKSDQNTTMAYELVRPGKVSASRMVPSDIALPRPIGVERNHDGLPRAVKPRSVPRSPKPEIKTKDQVVKMREAGKLARSMMNLAVEHAQVGITTDEIDAVVHDAIISNGAYPSPLHYKGFPKSICTSVNNVVCHGIPDDRPLKDGDIISIDITVQEARLANGVFLNGYHGDCAETVPIGRVDEAGLRLIEAAQTCRDVAIEACGPGRPFSIIGTSIGVVLNKLGYKVIPGFCGHGIGSYFHGPPDIYHFVNRYPGKMETGMTFTIEPIISERDDRVVILDDGWTAATVDHSRGAQFEHTILIGDTNVEILTI